MALECEWRSWLVPTDCSFAISFESSRLLLPAQVCRDAEDIGLWRKESAIQEAYLESAIKADYSAAECLLH